LFQQLPALSAFRRQNFIQEHAAETSRRAINAKRVLFVLRRDFSDAIANARFGFVNGAAKEPLQAAFKSATP
jgi:hypothetical protein